MKLQDMRNECLTGKWVPLVVFRQDGKTILPVFESMAIAQRFARRNFPKKWLTGAVNLDTRDSELLAGKNIQITIFQFPRKLGDGVELDIEIHEYDPDKELEVRTVRAR